MGRDGATGCFKRTNSVIYTFILCRFKDDHENNGRLSEPCMVTACVTTWHDVVMSSSVAKRMVQVTTGSSLVLIMVIFTSAYRKFPPTGINCHWFKNHPIRGIIKESSQETGRGAQRCDERGGLCSLNRCRVDSAARHATVGGYERQQKVQEVLRNQRRTSENVLTVP